MSKIIEMETYKLQLQEEKDKNKKLSNNGAFNHYFNRNKN
jgi:hypothetical protein